jgi:hypothetical protein
MPVLDVSGRTSRDIPEPQTVNVDPARANAIGIPNATPPVAVLSIPNVAVIFFPNNKLFVGVDILVDIYVLLDGYAPVDGYVLVDVGVLPLSCFAFAGAATASPSPARMERTMETFLSMLPPPLFKRYKNLQ